jgi:hypothetical protein
MRELEKNTLSRYPGIRTSGAIQMRNTAEPTSTLAPGFGALTDKSGGQQIRQTVASRMTRIGASQFGDSGRCGKNARKKTKTTNGAMYLAEGDASSQFLFRVSRVTW